jgi:hypothetical protein
MRLSGAGWPRASYLADESASAIAEWYRLLAERGLSPARAIPHDQPRLGVSRE